jgi:hypothetical protein
MRELYRLFPQFPTHANKRYRGLSALDAITAADADGNDERLAPKSQTDYSTHIQSLWKWSVENDHGAKCTSDPGTCSRSGDRFFFHGGTIAL